MKGDIQLSGKIENIPINLIDAPKEATRSLQASTVEEVGLSIRADGLYSPITVRPTQNGRFEVVAGYHRYEAIRRQYQAQRDMNTRPPTMPCLIRNLDDDEAGLVSITENTQRNQYDVDTVKQGEIFSRFIKKGWTVQQITERIGKKRVEFVANRILIFEKLHASLQNKLLYGHLPFRIAVILAGYPLNKQMAEYQKLQSKYVQITSEGCHHACKIHCPKPPKYQEKKPK